MKIYVNYYPNTSIYKVGKLCRYVEYENINAGMTHQTVSVHHSVYLDRILKKAKYGLKINELLSYLTENKIEYKYALEYIEELIDSQILVSELSPSVTGSDYFYRMIYILKKFNHNTRIVDILNDIQEVLHQLDFVHIDNTYQQRMALYNVIIQKIKEVNIPFEENYLFQVDMTRGLEKLTLGKDIVDVLKPVMIFLNKINQGNNIDEFLSNFYYKIEEKQNIMNEITGSFKYEFKLEGLYLKQFNMKYRKNKMVIESVLNNTLNEEKFDKLCFSIKKRTVNLQPIIDQIKRKSKNKHEINRLIKSYLHLTVNRIFPSKNRIHEMIISDFMFRYYTSEIAKKNNQLKYTNL